ncbi:hypothetical protein SB5439_05135 [Klebsiella variicola]|uniref:hypothetical protein n=1 Tax=Klebsiella variicola TaxID=244366 RepID=UPI00109CBE1D|nr:hypothetical protein [Klebsiella variicola]VGQ13060.1 hypothetical protein SB5439_05135 [Klebsiella variicola]
MKTLFKTVIAAAVISMTGCASVVNSTSQSLTVDSNPQGLPFVISDSKGIAVTSGVTPTSVTLPRGKGALHVEVKDKKGNVAGRGDFKESVSGWYFGNILLGGIVGLVVDAADDAMWKYSPEAIKIGTTINPHAETVGEPTTAAR